MNEFCCTVGVVALILFAFFARDILRPAKVAPRVRTERGHWMREDGRLVAVPDSKVNAKLESGAEYVEPYEDRGEVIVSMGRHSGVRVRGDHVIVED